MSLIYERNFSMKSSPQLPNEIVSFVVVGTYNLNESNCNT